MQFRDSVGNRYDSLPSKGKKGAKGTKVGPKHGRKSRYTGDQKKHGTNTGRNGASSRKRFYGEPKPRMEALTALFRRETKTPREGSKSPTKNSTPPA